MPCFAIQFIRNTPTQSARRRLLKVMQLSVRHGFNSGKVSLPRLKCIEALPDSSFDETISAVIAQVLTSAQIEAAEAFMSTAVGRKYAEHGLLQVYAAVGEKPPRPSPEFSDSEYRQIEIFADTPAGRLLFHRKVMESAGARRAYGSRIRELLAQCQNG